MIIPKHKIGHNQNRTTLEPLGTGVSVLIFTSSFRLCVRSYRFEHMGVDCRRFVLSKALCKSVRCLQSRVLSLSQPLVVAVLRLQIVQSRSYVHTQTPKWVGCLEPKSCGILQRRPLPARAPAFNSQLNPNYRRPTTPRYRQ